MMIFSQLIQSLAQSQASKLILRQKNMLKFYSMQFMTCRNCQHPRLLSSFYISHNTYPAYMSKDGIKSRASSSDIKSTVSTHETFGSRIRSTLQYFGWLVTRSSILQLRARQIYGYCTDDVDYKEFFKVCCMPDTFQSWFFVIHLHIWYLLSNVSEISSRMCYIRLNLLGDDGKTVNQKIAEFMWEDIRERIKKLGVEDTKARKEGFKELSQQFYGLTIAYNKALMSENEKDLADALFKTFFYEKTENSRKKLDALVEYVDRQLEMLDKLTKEDILGNMKIEWISLNDCIKS